MMVLSLSLEEGVQLGFYIQYFSSRLWTSADFSNYNKNVSTMSCPVFVILVFIHDGLALSNCQENRNSQLPGPNIQQGRISLALNCFSKQLAYIQWVFFTPNTTCLLVVATRILVLEASCPLLMNTTLYYLILVANASPSSQQLLVPLPFFCITMLLSERISSSQHTN